MHNWRKSCNILSKNGPARKIKQSHCVEHFAWSIFVSLSCPARSDFYTVDLQLTTDHFLSMASSSINQDLQFLCNILFEASFTRDGINNVHNTHVSGNKNSHAIIASRYQHRFSMNVWADIFGDYLIGPYILPNRQDKCLNFLKNNLFELLGDIK